MHLIDSMFFGLWLLPLGYLVTKSGYFPKPLGWFSGAADIVLVDRGEGDQLGRVDFDPARPDGVAPPR